MTDAPVRLADSADDTGGEVAIRENGQVTAFAASNLDGQISICLDNEDPEIGVPPHADVRFEDPTADDEVLADGGVADHVAVTSRGIGLEEDLAVFALVGTIFSLVGGGYLLSTANSFSGIVMVCVGLILTAILARQQEESLA
ncbi:hypothetical protein [Halorussus sp. MSC15.2]|uniref:hypothetical protein n=1 Tax=Halorussus sp. MSC15.2 TaxID=2283638 RepID=UPI0013D8CB00|nr:hypothetical protein [Halorussus sp. MSC15.2]NEU56745.1 hypothetical protein [Halorussus sp. MSC15.2]